MKWQDDDCSAEKYQEEIRTTVELLENQIW